MRSRRNERRGSERQAHCHGARADAGEERERDDAAGSHGEWNSPGPRRRPANIRVRECRAPRAVHRASEPRPFSKQVKRMAYSRPIIAAFVR